MADEVVDEIADAEIQEVGVQTEAARRSLLEQGVQLLARREHSRQELYTRLSQRCRDVALLTETVETLARQGLQDEARFAEAFIRTRIERGQGPLRIRRDLEQRGIATALIDQGLAMDEEAWCRLAEQARVKRYGRHRPGKAGDVARQARFLSTRGFCHEHIRRVFATEWESATTW